MQQVNARFGRTVSARTTSKSILDFIETKLNETRHRMSGNDINLKSVHRMMPLIGAFHRSASAKSLSNQHNMRTLQKMAALPLLGFLLLTGCCTSNPAKARWEYRVDRVQPHPPPGSALQEHLNSQASKGWVLAQFVEDGGEWVVVMKRFKSK